MISAANGRNVNTAAFIMAIHASTVKTFQKAASILHTREILEGILIVKNHQRGV